jgi:CRISPR-associated Cas5-like protein
MTEALQATITAAVASFRNPLYAGVQVGLDCPPPATVGGLLAAAAGGWDKISPQCRFAVVFHARGRGVDVETYHPLQAEGKHASPLPRDRHFLADVTLTVWLIDEPQMWQRRLRRPVWPLRLGRSQDLVDVRTRTVGLQAGSGRQGHALVPAGVTTAGTLLQLPTAIARDRSRTRWDAYRYHNTGAAAEIHDCWRTVKGQAVVLLPSTHPLHAETDVSA